MVGTWLTFHRCFLDKLSPKNRLASFGYNILALLNNASK